MRLHIPRRRLALACLAAIGACQPAAPGSDTVAADTTAVSPTPLVLALDEGERRVRRRLPDSGPGLTSPFILKVDRRNGGSRDLVMGYEDIPPGQAIRPHRHLIADEIIFVHRGSGVAELGDRVESFGPGATIYIPKNVRIALRNTGSEPISIAFFFSKPGFEELMRENSVLEGEPMVPLTQAERTANQERHKWHTQYEPPPR
jgi:quercetin dioxygenase-like cupin family protein